MGATIIDVGIYNLLKRPAAGWRRIPANMVSVSAGLTFNFFANWLLVFHPAGNELAGDGREASCDHFFFCLHPPERGDSPRHPSLAVASEAGVRGGLEQKFSEDFVSRNTAKAMAIGVGLVWNFCWYKFFVFAG